MHLKTIVKRVQNFKFFVYGRVRWVRNGMIWHTLLSFICFRESLANNGGTMARKPPDPARGPEVGDANQVRSKRSAFMTLFQAAAKSLTNFPPASAWA